MQLPLNIQRAVFMIICLASCKGQDHTNTLQDIPARSDQLENSIFQVNKVDTMYTLNAPQRIVRRIRKNKEGNLIIAAFTDVIIYDGNSFSKLPLPDGVESFDAFDALEASNGTIWIASTHFGVFRYDGSEYIHFTTDNGLASNRTIDLFEDHAGDIWVSTMSGISQFNENGIVNFTLQDGLVREDVNRIIEDQSGKFWIGTRGNASVYDGKTFSTITNDDGRPFTNVRHIIEDSRGHIWLGGSDGLWRYDGNHFLNCSSNFIGNIHEDSKGNIWALSDRWTLTVFTIQPKTYEILSATNIDTKSPMLFGLSEDRDGNIWVGTGSGVFIYDGHSIQYVLNESN